MARRQVVGVPQWNGPPIAVADGGNRVRPVRGSSETAVSATCFVDATSPSQTSERQTRSFVDRTGKAVRAVPAELGRYSIDTGTLTLEGTATAKVDLMEAGGELSGIGGIQLTLRRSRDDSSS
jgi:hypothetical protein